MTITTPEELAELEKAVVSSQQPAKSHDHKEETHGASEAPRDGPGRTSLRCCSPGEDSRPGPFAVAPEGGEALAADAREAAGYGGSPKLSFVQEGYGQRRREGVSPRPFLLPYGDQALFTQGEVARLCGVKLATVRGWVSRGIRRIRLRTLRVPRGRIAPGDLREFLVLLNRGLSPQGTASRAPTDG